MFYFEQEKFGEFDQLTIRHREKAFRLSVLPQLGAALNLLGLNASSFIPLIEQLPAKGLQDPAYAYQSAWLFPFPNRLSKGQYEFAGQTYQLPINEPELNNQLHGFVFDKPFEVTDTYADEDLAYAVLAYHYDGSLPGYPFPFFFEVTYELTAEQELAIRVQVRNTGTQEMPFGIGWHPYFAFGLKANKYFLRMPRCVQLPADAALIPTREEVAFSDFEFLRGISNKKLDHGFRLKGKPGCYETELWGPGGKDQVLVWQDKNFRFLQVYTPPARYSIAIEPMTCATNAFNNGIGLMQLAPGQEFTGRMGLRYTQKADSV